MTQQASCFMKFITLRFFDVNLTAGLTSSASLVKRVKAKLTSTVSERMMPVNKNSSDKFDIISNYLIIDNGKAIAGTCLRIANSKAVPVISEALLSQKQFTLNSINENAKDDEKTCLDYFYFCLSDEHLIITLDKRSSVTRFETYINWLLSTSESGEDITFVPVVDENRLSLADIKKITIGGKYNIPVNKEETAVERTFASKVIGITDTVLKSLLSDTSDLAELMASDICSADLVIKFSKPRSMSREEYLRKTAGAILKPLEDPDGIRFATNGKKISGSQALKSEEVEVDCDTNGALSEQNVYQTMFRKLKKL